VSDGLLGAPTGYWAAVAGAFGLVAGSFFTVLVHRWPRGESVVRPRSSCPACGHRLGARELVPVLSFLAARGRCRGCGGRVSWAYPAIEVASGALAAGSILAFGPTWRGLAAAIMALALVPVVVIDLRHQLIPDLIVLPAAALALLLAALADPDRAWVPLLGAVGAAAFLFVLWAVYPGGMGLGDVKLALLLGAALGASVVPALALAFLAGAGLGAGLLVRFGPRARKMAVPFGPFLAGGAIVALFAGPAMISWYGSLL
jgi:leader peptidase (prepilin peptidase) / N-methyltransferase